MSRLCLKTREIHWQSAIGRNTRNPGLALPSGHPRRYAADIEHIDGLYGTAESIVEC
jgi:hypothetical protein